MLNNPVPPPMLSRIAAAMFLISALVYGADVSSVKITERDTVIPTYLAGPPDPNPMFYFGRQSQGRRSAAGFLKAWTRPTITISFIGST
ncbi:MAG: hypothetical protein NTW28_14660 [Candidatus Solibacter sp.]|nr:hypothetical protein [Candidatus Solibacter sp.]